MSATEQLIERVMKFDENKAKLALDLLDTLPEAAPEPPAPSPKPLGDVYSAVGYAEKYNHPYKTTAEWMKILREGEED